MGPRIREDNGRGGGGKRWGRNSGEILRGPRNDNWAVRGMGPRIREDNGRGRGRSGGGATATRFFEGLGMTIGQ